MPPRNPTPARYVVEIRDAAGVSLLLTSADWTAKERNLAMSTVLKLVRFKPAAPATRKAGKARSGAAPSAKGAEELSGQRVGAFTP